MTLPKFLNDLSNPNTLYIDYITRQQQLIERICERFGLAYLLIASGVPIHHFNDDLVYPFKVNPYFKQWLPLTQSPGSYVLLVPGNKPTLFLYQPDNTWTTWPRLDSCDWAAQSSITSLFTVETIKHKKDINTHLLTKETTFAVGAFIGSPACLHSDWSTTRINDAAILSFINFHRSYKSEYEIYCLYQANLRAVPGHRKAEVLFNSGATEADVLWGYLAACKAIQQDDPYEPVIAYNLHGATLHYQQKSLSLPADGLRSMLIDAGNSFAGYSSDISRTYSYGNDEFSYLIKQLDILQQELVTQIEKGVTQAELHNRSYWAMATFMKTHGFITCSEEEAIDVKLIDYFYPHRLGHFLGLQVHDVGDHLVDEMGSRARADSRHPTLSNRPIDTNMVFTIEPGFYFIDTKLKQLNLSSYSNLINWDRVNYFCPYGGIRIEDDIFFSDQGVVNLTRTAFDH